MYDGKCPCCAKRGNFSERGLKHWTVSRNDDDGGRCEVCVATDYYWHCELCGKAFSEHIVEPGIEHTHRPRRSDE